MAAPSSDFLPSSHFIILPACDGCVVVGRHCSSMEVDYPPLDECKEGDDGAPFDGHESKDGGSGDFSMQIDHGQGELSPSVPARPKWKSC